jgi:hypothetical protein
LLLAVLFDIILYQMSVTQAKKGKQHGLHYKAISIIQPAAPESVDSVASLVLDVPLPMAVSRQEQLPHGLLVCSLCLGLPRQP